MSYARLNASRICRMRLSVGISSRDVDRRGVARGSAVQRGQRRLSARLQLLRFGRPFSQNNRHNIGFELRCMPRLPAWRRCSRCSRSALHGQRSAGRERSTGDCISKRSTRGRFEFFRQGAVHPSPSLTQVIPSTFLTSENIDSRRRELNSQYPITSELHHARSRGR